MFKFPTPQPCAGCPSHPGGSPTGKQNSLRKGVGWVAKTIGAVLGWVPWQGASGSTRGPQAVAKEASMDQHDEERQEDQHDDEF
jgi:hypothetical protein